VKADSLHGLTLPDWRQKLVEHKAIRPNNLDVEALRKWVISKDWIQASIDILENQERGRWRPVTP